MATKERGWLSEGILIVISILVAFAIDAWWEARQDREAEARILVSLRQEFQANVDRLPRFVEQNKLAADLRERVIHDMREAGPGGRVEMRAFDLAYALIQGTSDPQQGALDAILSSGELRYLEDRELRERLAGWPKLVIDATENEVLLREIWGPRMSDALSASADLSVLAKLPVECWQKGTAPECDALMVELTYDTRFMGPALQAWHRDRAIPLVGKVLAVLTMTASVVWLALYSDLPGIAVAAVGAGLTCLATWIVTRPTAARRA